ncbi:MAG: sensor histidine kinase [Bacteroidales bacterium]|nr:sensor histidine kinase [Bacteroidales bacterium]
MKFRLLIISFYIISGLFYSEVTAQSFTEQTDSILRDLSGITNDSLRIVRLSDVAYSFENNEPDVSIMLYDEAIRLSRKMGFPFLEGLNARYKGLVFKNQARYDSALQWMHLAVDLITEEISITEKAKAYFSLATIYQLKGDFERATTHYISSMKLFEKTGNEVGISKASSNLGAMYFEMNQTDKALYYDSIAVDNARWLNDSTGLASALVNLGTARNKSGDHETALGHFLEAMAIARAISDEFILSYIYSNLADYYGNLDQYNEALQFSGLAYELARKNNNPAEMSAFLHYKGFYQVKTGAGTEGILNMKEALRLNRKYGLKEERIGLLNHLAEAYELVDNTRDALIFVRAAHDLKDSIYTEEMMENIHELRLNYETEKKEKQIAELQYQQELNQKNRIFLIWSSAGLGLLLILSVILLIFYRQKLKINLLLAKQNEEISRRKIQALEQEKTIHSMDAMIRGQEEERKRIANDLHDGLGSLLSTIQIHFNKIQEELEHLQKLKTHLRAFEMLDDACAEVRKISHDMMPGSLEKLGLQAALKDLVSRIETSANLKVVFQEFGDKKHLDKTNETMLFRIVQEMLNNVVKHAEAKEVILQLTWHEHSLNVIVEDDGKGFDANLVDAGIGLQSIRQRVDYLGGELGIDTQKGRGSTFTIDIPLNKNPKE